MLGMRSDFFDGRVHVLSAGNAGAERGRNQRTIYSLQPMITARNSSFGGF